MARQTHTGILSRPSFTPVLTGVLQRKCACGGAPGPDGECTECRAKRLSRQHRSSANHDALSSVPPIVHEVIQSPGKPLDTDTRALMEPRLGHDFANVRVHTYTRAAESAQAVDALAYTVGRDVVFGARQYEPGTTEGRRLLAHELTHVVQQGPGEPATPAFQAIGAPSSPAEREAEQAASRITQGERGTASAGIASGTLQRQETEDDEYRLRLGQPGQGLGYKPPRIGLDLPELQLDPQIAMQIRAIQFARGLLTIDNIMTAAGQIGGGTLDPSQPAAPGTVPSLAPPLIPSPGQPGAGSPALSGLGQPSPAPSPPVPRGKGPEKPRAATAGDLVKAVLKIPAVEATVDRLRTQAESELRADWEGLSGGEKALVITQGVVLGASVVAGVASDPEASRFVLGLAQGKDIPIPKLPMTFRFDLIGPDQRLTIGLDVGALLPPALGFGPRR